jgi:hypothetical protein
MVFTKAANDIRSDLDFVVRNGVGILIEDMKKAPRFDRNNPPEWGKKDEYFNNANNICQSSLWKLGLYDLCETYYGILLKEIRKHERDNKTDLNKGMVYANLGVAQAAQGKIDEGFSNILKAHMEDEPYHKTDPSRSVFNLKLYYQFEEGSEGREGTKDYILKHSQLYQKEETKTIDKAFITGLIASLDTDSHLLHISLVEKIRRNLEILSDKDNRFTRLQIFLCLQDLCLAIENSLKTKNKITGTLKEILDILFSIASGRQRLPWKPILDANYGFASSDNASQLRKNMEEIFKIGDYKARRLLLCCAFRNFSAHNLDVGNDYVFKNIEVIFDNLVSCILFLYDSQRV